MVAWELHQGQKCPCGCGLPAVETMAKENQYAYGAELIRCHARAAMQRTMDAYEQQEGSDTSGLMPRLSYGPHGTM